MDKKKHNREQQKKAYRKMRLNNPGAFIRYNKRKREQRRQKRLSDPRWIIKQMKKLIAECEQTTKRFQREQKKKQKKLLKQDKQYQKITLIKRLSGQRQNTRDLTDGYIRRKLCHRARLDRKDIPMELVVFKRAQMILNRTIKELKNENNERIKTTIDQKR